MMTNQGQWAYQVFLVRLWIETQEDGQAVWHGKVQRLTSGEAYRFDDWADLVATLQDMLPDPTDRSPPDDHLEEGGT